MRDEDGVSLAELARLTGSRLVGDATLRVVQVAPLQSACTGQVAFLANGRYQRYLAETAASAVILRQEDAPDSAAIALLISDNPYLAFARAARILNPEPPAVAEVHAQASVAASVRMGRDVRVGACAVIEEDVEIGDDVVVGAGTVVGRGSRIGDGCRIAANVTLCAGTTLGRRVRLNAGCVVGSDGFGFANDNGRWEKVPQLGHVLIGDDVEVGANTTIDCGALGDTVIEEGVKIDNLVQIAHNVHIGAHSAMASMVGISGSTTVGPGTTIGGAAGIGGHLTIAGGTVITGMSMISHDIREPGVYSSGTPMGPNRQWRRNAARFTQLDEMARRLRTLEKRLAEIERDQQED